MPIYEYVCTACQDKFEVLQSMGAKDADCPDCRQPARRVVSLFAAVSGGNEGESSGLPGMGGCGACHGGACACGH